ncbi:MAG: PASTA domain-containing protein [Pyrinomonadaceae bacterium]
MSFVNSGLSAIGRLAALAVLLGAFLIGLVVVVVMSLQGSEIHVPEITGKNVGDSEKELASLGLKMKKRADRVSAEEPGTVIEQLPKAGETVKTGQLILVVTSKGPGEGGSAPPSLKNTDEDDSDKIEEMISEKPKKPKANSNTNRKKADTTRDVNAAPSNGTDSNSGSDSNSSSTNSNKAGNTNKSGSNSNSNDKTNRNTQTPPGRLPNPTTKPSSGERPKRP